MKYDITFHPSWWNKNLGIRFTEEFFNNPEYRIASDVKMRRFLFEKFGEWGIGEETPEPRAILGSDLIASGYLYSKLLGCDIRFSEEAPPEVICAALSEEDTLEFEAPSLTENQDWQIIENQIEWLQKEYGCVHSAINLQGVLNLALDLRGDSIEILSNVVDEKRTTSSNLRSFFHEVTVFTEASLNHFRDELIPSHLLPGLLRFTA